MKGKLKLIILSMLALFLVACGSATPSPGGGTGSEITPKPGGGTGTGGGTTPKEPVISKGWQKIENEIGTEVEKAQGETERDSLSKSNYQVGHIKGLYIKENTIVEYNEGQVEEIVPDTTTKRLYLNINSHLEFKGNVGEIKFQRVNNWGNMYFVDNLEEPREYVVITDEDKLSTSSSSHLYRVENYGNIYVMDGNGGSTLKIDAVYLAIDGNIHLGLYVSEDGKKFSTDKVHITGVAAGSTKVKFVYNAEQVKNLKEDAEYHGKDDYVIKVDGEIKAYDKNYKTIDLKDAFIMEGSFPVGLNSYKLKFEHEGSEELDAKGHIWKLKMKKK